MGAPTRLIPLKLTLDTADFHREIDRASEYARKKFGGGGRPASTPTPASPAGPSPSAREREEMRAVEQLQRQRSSALVRQWEQEARAAAQLQRQRSTALFAQWREEQREHARVQNEIVRAEQRAARARTSEWEASSNRVKSVVTAMAAAVVVTIGTIVAASTAAAFQMDTLMRSLEAVAGSRGAAAAQFQRAREIAKLPGLGIQEAVEGLVKLQAASDSLKELSSSADRLALADNTLRQFGNALATVGKGKNELAGVNEQIAQILSKNKIMASDIRILSEYVPQLRGAISAAFGTSDTEQLQKRGIGAVEFLTKVNAELGKLPRVGNTAKNAVENFGDALFLAGASLGEVFLPALIKILELITPLIGGLAEMRGVLALVTVAVLAATVAMVAFHTGAVGGVIAGAARLVSSLQAVYVSMRLVATGSTTMAASTVVGIAGWVGLVAILAAVAYGLYTVVTAEKEIAAVTDEQVKASERQIGLRENELELLTRLGDGTRATAGEQLRQKEIYDALDGGSRARVTALAEETSKTEALAAETKRLLEMERERQRIQGANLAAKFTQELEKYNELLAERARLEGTLLGAERRRLRGDDQPVELDVAAGQQRIVDLSAERLGEVNTELEAQEQAVRGLARSLVNYRDTTEQSIESAFELAKVLNLGKGETNALVTEVVRLAKEQKDTAKQVDEATAALERHLKVTRELSETYDEESKKRKELIEGTLNIISHSSGGDLKIAREQLRQYLNDPAFREAVETERQIKRIRKALDEIIDPDKVRHQKDAAEKLTDRLKSLRAEVESFSNLRSPSFDERFESEKLERVKRDYERILDLRREFRLPLRAALPGPNDEAGLRAQLESLEALKRVRDEVLKVTYEQRDAEEAYAAALATSTIPVVDAGLRAETKYLKAVRDRQAAERELTADLIAQTRLRRDAVEDEVGATKKAYESVRLELLKQLGDLDEGIKRNQVLSLIERGGEITIQNQISGRLDVKTPKPPTELQTIAQEAVKQTASLQHIEAALTGGTSGRVAVNSKRFQPEFEAALGGLLSFLKASGLDPTIKSGARDAAEQNALFRRLGTSRTPHDGFNSISPHQTGTGADIGFPAGQRARGQALIRQYLEAHPESGLENAFVKGKREPWHVQIAELHKAVLGGAVSSEPSITPGARAFGEGLVKLLLDGDALKAFVSEWAGRLTNPEALKALNGEGDPVRTDSTAVGGSALALTHEKALKTAIKERGDRERELTDEIRQNEYRLAFDLIDIDLEVAAARTRTRVERRAEERSLEVELKALRADAADDQLSEQRRLLAAKREEVDLTRRSIELQDEYANAGVNVALRQQVAVMEEIVAIRRADVEAIERQARAEVRLADQTVVHSGQVRARVLEHLSSQKSATESYADTITTAYDSITGAITRGVSQLTGGVRILDSLLASILNRIVSRVFQRFLDAFFPDSGSSRGGGGGSFSFIGGQGGGGGASLTSSLARVISGGGSNGSPFSGNLFSLLNSSGGSPFSGNLFSLLEGSGAGVAGAPPVPGSMMSGTSNLFAGLSPELRRNLSLMALDDPGLLSGGAGGLSSIFGAGGFGGFARGPLAQMLPLLGVGLGAGLGGQSTGGRILGGVGGALGGLLGMGLLQGGGLAGILGGQVGNLMGFLGLGGALGAATLGVGAAVALIGAVILGRNKQRREDEKKRDSYSNELGTAVWQMITDIKAGADASSTLAQLPALEQRYLQQANAIKDSKTRRHALLWFNNPPETGDYQAAKKILMQVANESLEAKARAQNQVPEYAEGLDAGLVGMHLIKVKPGERFLPPSAVAELVRKGGLIPGTPSALDNTYMYAPAGSAVMNEEQQRAMQSSGGRMLPVPAISTPPPLTAGSGGADAAALVAAALSNIGFQVVINETPRADEKEVILKVLSSREGGRVIAQHKQNAKLHGRQGS